jgi:hypothetical protein
MAVIAIWQRQRQLTPVEKRVGKWSMRLAGTSYHHQFDLRRDHSYAETSWSDDGWHEVVSGHWRADDGTIRLYEDWNTSIVEKLEWRLMGRNVAVLQIQQQGPDRLVLQCRGSPRMMWMRGEMVR